MTDTQMNKWITMCTRLCGGPISDEASIKMLLSEGKSPLLNACVKEFGEEIVYSTELSFELTDGSVRKVFDIINMVFFNGIFNSFTDFELFVGDPAHLNSTAQNDYAHNSLFDLSMFFANYLPDLKYKIENNLLKDIELRKDAIFFNTDTNKTATLSYVIATLSHEMIHCVDMRKGTLKDLTLKMLQKYAPGEVISYVSHFTPLFKSKRETMKNTNGITIQLTGDDQSFVEMNKSAADEIQNLRESDGMSVAQDVYDMFSSDPDYWNEKYKGFVHFDPDSSEMSIIFGQLKPGKTHGTLH